MKILSWLTLVVCMVTKLYPQPSCEDFLQFAAEKSCAVENETLVQLYGKFLENLTPSDERVLMAVGGSPGSGKTTFRRKFLSHENVHIHDMDEVMVMLPKYQGDLKSIGPKTAFEKWWPLARELAHLLVSYAIESGYSVIYDRTCGAENSYFDLLNAHKRGYTIRLIGLYVDREVALERIRQREKDEGRVITEAIMVEYRARFSALWPYYLKLVDSAELYDNSADTPRLVFASRSGVCNPAVYEKFLQEGASFEEYFAKKLQSVVE